MVDDESIAIFNALGDKTRYKLFKFLGQEPEACVGQLAEEFNISSACVSQHMKILSDSGLVQRYRNGQRVCYKILANSPNKKTVNKLVFNK